jgi:hypothetical protein
VQADVIFTNATARTVGFMSGAQFAYFSRQGYIRGGYQGAVADVGIRVRVPGHGTAALRSNVDVVACWRSEPDDASAQQKPLAPGTYDLFTEIPFIGARHPWLTVPLRVRVLASSEDQLRRFCEARNEVSCVRRARQWLPLRP